MQSRAHPRREPLCPSHDRHWQSRDRKEAVSRAAQSRDHQAAVRLSPARPLLRGRAVTRHSPSHRRGITLLEVIIAIALIALLLSSVLTFFWQTAKIREQAALQADKAMIARRVLDGIANELRGCLGREALGFPVAQRFIGTRRSMTFLTTALPDPARYRYYKATEDMPPAQHDVREVGYSLWTDPEKTTESGDPLVGGIVRTEKRALGQALIDEEDPLSIRKDLWSHELGYIEFRYYDGVEWDTQWEIVQGNSLPQMVMVTVGFDSILQAELEDQDLDEFPIDKFPLGDELEHPNRYTTVIRIPAADRMFGSRLQRVGTKMSEQLGVGGLP